jgi:hypothetical protein
LSGIIIHSCPEYGTAVSYKVYHILMQKKIKFLLNISDISKKEAALGAVASAT